jgi:hypothetical protein
VEGGRCKFISWHHCCGSDNRLDVLVLAKRLLYSSWFSRMWSNNSVECEKRRQAVAAFSTSCMGFTWSGFQNSGTIESSKKVCM